MTVHLHRSSITRLRIFVEIHIFMNIIEKVKPRQYYYVLNILYIFVCYSHSGQLEIFSKCIKIRGLSMIHGR